jgi:periplasmic divalent cation tolerance protein
MAVGDLDVAFCICPKTVAQKITKEVLSERVASCVDELSSEVSTLYAWQNHQIQDDEVILLITTVEELFDDLVEVILESHPYKMPVIVTIDYRNVNRKYYKWLLERLDEEDEENSEELDNDVEEALGEDVEHLEEKQASVSSTQENEPLTTQKLQELFVSSLPKLQKSFWCEQINSQYGHFREGTNTGFTIPKRREAIEDIYDHFFPNAVIGFEPEELQKWLSSGYQSHPNYGIAALPPKTISNLRKPDAEDTDAIIAIATEDASVVEQFFCELLGIKREESEK